MTDRCFHIGITRRGFLSALLLCCAVAMGQSNRVDSLQELIARTTEDSAKISLQNQLIRLYLRFDLQKAESIAEEASAQAIAIEHLDLAGEALNALGIAHFYQGNYEPCLEAWERADSVYRLAKDTGGMANIHSNMGAVYANKQQAAEALDHYLKGLAMAEAIDRKHRIATLLLNIGALYIEDDEYQERARGYLKRALSLADSHDYRDVKYTALINLAELDSGQVQMERFKAARRLTQLEEAKVYLMTRQAENLLRAGQLERATDTLQKALALATAKQYRSNLLKGYLTLGKAYREADRDAEAIEAFKEAAHWSKVLGEYQDRVIAYEGLRHAYAYQNEYDSAYHYADLMIEAQDSLDRAETSKLLDNQLFKFSLQKKENAIALLEEERKVKELTIRNQRYLGLAIGVGLTGALILLLVVFRQRNKINKEKDRSDRLLRNILPAEIAEELKEKGQAGARQFDEATVLFTDFKAFTLKAEQLTANQLVEELNTCFKAFDEICEKYQIEKIKTIGDSFMAAGGLPVPDLEAPARVILAALEMQDFMQQYNALRKAADEPIFEMRTGIHSGPVVAGIVGVKKFQYDIWGDTVNTASRMESNGKAGCVNISKSTYTLVADDPRFQFEARGEKAVKGKGRIAMYFVDRTSG